MTQHPAHTISQAPMMDWSTRHQRVFMRSITRQSLLYTEMVTAPALVFGDAERLLEHNPAEYPLALQLGGSDPEQLAAATRIAAQHPYYEINLNLGCPSDRVQSGQFGASLMADPVRVRECLQAMASASGPIPISAKIRIGIDEQDPDKTLLPFVEHIADLNLNTLTVHARKAILKGLSPKQNREIPPLQPERAADIKRAMPHLTVVLNGQLENPAVDSAWLNRLDGLMYGRAAYHTPWCLADVDRSIFGGSAPHDSPEEALRSCYGYLEGELSKGVPLAHFTRHVLGLFKDRPGARNYRRTLTEDAHKPGAGIDVIERALAHLTLERKTQ